MSWCCIFLVTPWFMGVKEHVLHYNNGCDLMDLDNNESVRHGGFCIELWLHRQIHFWFGLEQLRRQR